MNADESYAVAMVGHAWNALLKAVPDAASRAEACAAIHTLQNLVLAQATIRDHPHLLRQPLPLIPKGPE